MITPTQTKIIHIAAKRVGMNDAQYRTLLANAGGAASSRDLDQAGFEDVMAVLEDMGFAANSAGMHSCYWRNKVRDRGAKVGERMRRKIVMMSEGGRYPLPAMVRRMSAGRTEAIEELLPREAWNLIEALKAIEAREAPGPADRSGKDARPQGRGTGQGSPFLF